MTDYVTIERADNAAIADLIKQRLDQADIPCMVVPGNMMAVAGAGASFTITVPADRADEARELLGRLARGESTAALQRGEVGRAEDHAVARRDVDEVEVDSGLRDPAGQVRQHAGTVLDVDHDDLALARDREVEIASACLAASACGTRMCSSARSPVPMQVAAAMFTPASLIAAATCASAPGVFSMSMTRSTAMFGTLTA